MNSLAKITILGLKLVFECRAFIRFRLSGIAVVEMNHISQALEVLYNTSIEDDYTIKIDEKNLAQDSPDNQFYGSLEPTRCFAGAKQHPGLIIDTIAGTESSFVTIFIVHSSRHSS